MDLDALRLYKDSSSKTDDYLHLLFSDKNNILFLHLCRLIVNKYQLNEDKLDGKWYI